MRIDDRYKLRCVAKEQVLLVQGTVGGEMTKVIAFNDTSVLLWDTFRGKDFTVSDVVSKLMAEFEVSEEIARRDADHWVDLLKGYGVIK